ncbi:MAG TPA: DNA polymerase III subunit beta [bacterium]|nr:DNA polymerase III subunit beta [bacterium]
MNLYTKTFKKTVEDAARFCDRKGSLPIITRLRLTATEAGLRFEATDLDHRFSRVIPVRDPLSFDLLVPCERLLKIAKHLTGSTVSVAYAGHTLHFTDDLSFSIVIDKDVDDFPEHPAMAETREIPLLPKRFFEHLVTILPFTSDEKYNRAYAGVLVDPAQGAEEGLSLVATDIHRVSVVTLKGTQVPYPFVIPSSAIPALAKIFTEDRPTRLALSSEVVPEHRLSEGGAFVPSHLDIETGDTRVHIRLRKNEFPQYRNVVPRPASLFGHQIDPEPFLKKLKGLLSFADKKIPAALLHFENGKASVSTKDETANEVSAKIPVVSHPIATPLQKGVNLRYFAEALAAMCGTTVVTENDPEHLCPLILARETSDLRFLHMVMPLRV